MFRMVLIAILCLGTGRGLTAGIVLSGYSAVPLSHNSVQIAWSTVSEDNNYAFWIQRSPDGQANYGTVPGSFTAGFGVPHSYSFTDTTSSPGVWYYRLQQMDLDSSLWYSDGELVHVPAQQPILVSPADNALDIPLTGVLVWRAAAGAQSYHLQVSPDSLFSSPIVDDPSVPDTSATAGPLANLVRYFWRVRANATPVSSPFSSVWDFTTVEAPPAQVGLVSPPDGDTLAETSVNLLWLRPGPSVDAYTVELALDPLFVTPLVDSTVSDTTLQLHGLQHQQEYWWRVAASNAGGSGAFSNPRRFAVSFVTQTVINEGWNMISNPVLTTADSLHQLYPTAVSSAFAFHPLTGYVQRSVLENGTGYWAKFGAATTNEVGGAPITTQYIPVVAGWNIVGSISAPVDTGAVVTSPPGIRISPFYGYSNGIVVAPAIEPGKAYWVKVNAPGFVILAEE